MKSFLILIAILSGPPSPFGEVVAEETARAQAVITDQFGQPVPITRDSTTGLIVFSARKSVHGVALGSVKWTVFPAEYDARKWVPNPDGLEFGIALEGQPVTLMVILSVASGDTVDHLVLEVKCGKGPQPPPVPPVPPVPPTPVAKSLRLIVVEDQFNRKPETASILNARVFWDSLKSRGHSFAIYAENDPTAVGVEAVRTVRGKAGVSAFPVGAAYLLLKNAETSEVLSVIPLPTVVEIESLIQRYTGVK